MSLLAAHSPVDFDPALVAEQTYVTRRRRGRLSVTALLGAHVLLLYLLPAHIIVPNLTYAGRPALLVAFGLWCWWLLTRLNPRLVMVGPQPLRWVAMFYLVSMLMSYIAGVMRGLPEIEANAQNFTLLVTCEFLGVILMAADGVPNLARLNGLLKIFVWSAAFMGLVGIIQSTFKFDLAQYISVPGLHAKDEVLGFQDRGDSGLFRVAGTATHYIEFSAVLAIAVPFAIHYVRFSDTRKQRLLYGTLGVIICAAIPMAISRTGIVALIAGLAVMFLTVWNWRMRYNAALIAAVMAGGLTVLKPGLLGTLRYLFFAGSQDDSLTGRTNDYDFVSQWFGQRPLLGRGPGTLIPTLYLYLDNQWLLALVTLGVVGVVALAALHVTCISLAGIALRRASRPVDKHLCAALISVQVIAILVGATFDSLSFTTFAFTLAVTSGLCGAMWRFTHPARIIRTSAVRWQVAWPERPVPTANG